ncbi:MAG: hypothetical protein H6838_19900 [Planctomycetes bacterium]|nr:hypothetical protein [Planctomycetota bacterium]MCB9887762.1 hypothetical protein [Planctomycetota bacterium]
MTQQGTAAFPPAAPSAPPVVRVVGGASNGFSGIAALGAAMAGFLSYGRDPDLLTTAIAAGLTFVGALIALHVLSFVFRLAVLLGKIAVPVVVILLVGCALDWPWAETAAGWLRTIGSHGLHAAEQGLAALRAR